MDSEITTANRIRLRRFIEEQADDLLGTLRVYVARAGLAHGEGVTLAAVELMNEVVVEALEYAGRFRPDGRPMAWLLGIAANLIRRRQTRYAVDGRREPLARDVCRGETWSEDELFDYLATLAVEGPAEEVEARAEVERLLARVSKSDRRVLRLAIMHDLNGKELAQALHVTPGAARVRLHRALNRARDAWHTQGEGRDG
jgi:RNA polymerase sigma-70 factor (ECF subfamily)